MLAIKNYTYPQCRKRTKLTSRLIKHLNACTSQLQGIQPNWNSLILVKNDNILEFFIYHKKNEYPLGNKAHNVEKDQRDLLGKS